MSLNNWFYRIVGLGSNLGVNSVPVVGWLWGDWSPSTVMILYLIETLLGAALVSLRIVWVRPFVPLDASERRKVREWLQTYLLLVAGFAGGGGLFMGIIFFGLLQITPDLPALQTGLSQMAVFLAIGLVADLLFWRPYSLAEIEPIFMPNLGRVFLIFLAVFIGFGLAAWREQWFVWPFVILKTMADLDGWLTLVRRPVGGASALFVQAKIQHKSTKR